MTPRRIQFGARKNTASPRQHALRLAINSLQSQSRRIPRNPDTGEPSLPPAQCKEQTFDLPLKDMQNGATGGEDQEKSQLLTVQEVAELLRVPVSWVYEHTRQRCGNRIPGFRLGKYWRFSVADITAWLAAKRIIDYHHA